jgi:cytochrome c
MFKKLISLALLFSFACTTPAAENEPTQKDAIQMVDAAAAYLKKHGKDKLLEAVNDPKGEFRKGELYVFVYDMTATILAHPVNPKLIGKNTFDVADVDGKYYRREIVELAKTKKSGWVDYKYKNPETNKVEAKTSYILSAGDVILVAGIYKN